MNKIVFLLAIVLVFAIGCGKKAEAPTTEEIMSEEFVTAPETQAPQVVQPQIAGTPMSEPSATEGIPLETTATVAAPEKPTIQDIQKALKNAGLYAGKVDGVLGPKTKNAIEAFQKQNNLKADGKVGPKTWDKLKTYLTKIEKR